MDWEGSRWYKRWPVPVHRKRDALEDTTPASKDLAEGRCRHHYHPRTARGTSMTLKTDATGDLKVFDGFLTNIRHSILFMDTSTPILQIRHNE